MRTIRLRTVLFALLLLPACSGGGGGGGITPPPDPPDPPRERPTLAQTYRPTGRGAAGDVFVHLFDWRWADVASECETVLGPAGYHAVQVSPPQEHSITPGHDWSERYQPVSYSLARSRSGTQAEFVDMVNRCRAVGVGIYVDAVINHMTNFPSPGSGSAGTAYSKYSYPGLYNEADFHTPCALNDYQSAANVQDCELFGLPDLKTESASVRQKIAGYLIMLARLGVAGYRIDAAKHIQPVDLDEILRIVNTTLAAEGRPIPYVFLEVIDYNGNEAVRDRDYFGEGYGSGGAADLTEFIFKGIGNKFLNLGNERLFQLNPAGTPGNQFSEAAWGLMPSDKAVVSRENHDTQRDAGISYREPQLYRLASVFMLAQPYGYPSVMSSFAFSRPSQNSMGPPSDAAGWTLPVTCASSMETAVVGQWVCEHRDPYIRGMVRFRKVVAGSPVANWFDNGANAIAFSRGAKGFVAINRESGPLAATLQTGLPAGTYCDVLTGGRDGAACAGDTIVVGPGGSAVLNLAAMSAVAIHVEARL